MRGKKKGRAEGKRYRQERNTSKDERRVMDDREEQEISPLLRILCPISALMPAAGETIQLHLNTLTSTTKSMKSGHCRPKF